MATNTSTEADVVLPRSRREWRIWLFLVLGVGLLGLGASIYLAVRDYSITAPAIHFMPPLLFGFLATLLLLHFYLAQKEAVIEALREEVIDQKIEAELNRELALLDPVTEVYNRRYARIILQREVSRANRYGSTIALMMIDVTSFRRVNESLGHTGGDVVLRQIAHLLQNKIRNSDIIIRFGGDEFLLVLPEAQKEGIEKLVVRLKESFLSWAPTAGLGDFGLRFAIGVAYYTSDSQIDKVLTLAEDRMLQDRAVDSDRPRAGTGAARLSAASLGS